MKGIPQEKIIQNVFASFQGRHEMEGTFYFDALKKHFFFSNEFSKEWKVMWQNNKD